MNVYIIRLFCLQGFFRGVRQALVEIAFFVLLMYALMRIDILFH